MEVLDLYDINRSLLDRKINRGKKIDDGEYVLVTIAVIMNSDNKVLVTKRSQNKVIAPGKWEFTSGSVLSGENSYNAAIREVYEETGLDVKASKASLIDTFYEEQLIFDCWLFEKDFNRSEITLDSYEVDEYKIIPIIELNTFITLNTTAKSFKRVHKKILHEVATKSRVV